MSLEHTGPYPRAVLSGAQWLRALALFWHGAMATARILAGVALVVQLVVTLSDVVDRSLFGHALTWSGEAANLTLTVIAFIGGGVAYHDDRHACVLVLRNACPAPLRRALEAGTEAAVLWLAAAVAYGSIDLIGTHWNDVTPVLQLGVNWSVGVFTAGMSIIAISALARLLTRHDWRCALRALAVVSAAAAVLIGASPVPWLMEHGDAALACTVLLLFVAVLLGVPVSLAILLATVTYSLTTDTIPVVAAPQNMLDGVSNFILLALPFFILAGAIMEKGGISLRLVQLAMSLVGRLRGGLLQVIVVAVFLVSGISGSKVADVAAVGPIVRNELRRRGYRTELGGAVLAASAAMAETIPPSIAMLVLGSVTSISIGTLFVAGLLPAVVLALCLMVLNFFVAPRAAADASAPAGRGMARSAAAAVLPLAMPVGMFVGMRFGIATPTEISSFAVLYSLVLSVTVYREFTLRHLGALAADCASTAGSVLFVLAVASAFAWTLSAANLPQSMVEVLHLVGDSPTLFMAGSVALLIVVGSLLEGLPAIMILAPLLLPLAIRLGISDVQYGIVLILAMGIGAFIPPIGIGFYVAAAVSESKVEGAALAMLPYIAALVVGVLLVAFVPWITLALPNAFRP